MVGRLVKCRSVKGSCQRVFYLQHVCIVIPFRKNNKLCFKYTTIESIYRLRIRVNITQSSVFVNSQLRTNRRLAFLVRKSVQNSVEVKLMRLDESSLIYSFEEIKYDRNMKSQGFKTLVICIPSIHKERQKDIKIFFLRESEYM